MTENDERPAEEKLLENGWDGIVFLTNDSYDTALIGVTDDGQAVYDYDLMVEWLVKRRKMTYEDAAEWIDYNTVRALPYMGARHPVIMYRLE